MKRIIALAFVLSLLFSPLAFALSCETSQAYGASDACWTKAGITSNDLAGVVTGTVMVYDFSTPTQQGNDSTDSSWNVRAISSNDQGNIVAGIIQKIPTSGDSVMLLVRGKGKLRTITGSTIVSGDRLYAFGATTGSNRGTASNVGSDRPIVASRDRAIAFALENSSSSATIDAYITVI